MWTTELKYSRTTTTSPKLRESTTTNTESPKQQNLNSRDYDSCRLSCPINKSMKDKQLLCRTLFELAETPALCEEIVPPVFWAEAVTHIVVIYCTMIEWLLSWGSVSTSTDCILSAAAFNLTWLLPVSHSDPRCASWPISLLLALMPTIKCCPCFPHIPCTSLEA